MDDLFTRSVDEIITEAELQKLLKSKSKLRLKLGVDPSSPDIHLGHSVILRKLRAFQELGHTVIFVIGDATARIGDPSGRNKTRPVLNEDEITANAQTYLDQVGKILDVSKAEIRRNSEWLDKLTLTKLIQLASQFTVAQLIERDDFQKRLAAGQELSLHELLYPMMQAYDSVMLEADVEFGGTDQRFNMLAGRALQKKMGQKPQQVFITKLIVGTDGVNKMSKSLGNYIGLTDQPADMFGKVMSIPDQLIAEYYELCTEVKLGVIHELVKTLATGANPRDAKASLAREIVTLYHGDEAAEAAEESFNKQFRDNKTPAEMAEFTVSAGKHDPVSYVVASGMASSRSEARRLIEQGGFKLDGKKLALDKDIVAKSGSILQRSNKEFRRATVK